MSCISIVSSYIYSCTVVIIRSKKYLRSKNESSILSFFRYGTLKNKKSHNWCMCVLYVTLIRDMKICLYTKITNLAISTAIILTYSTKNCPDDKTKYPVLVPVRLEKRSRQFVQSPFVSKRTKE